MNQFTDLEFTKNTLDRYYIRNSIFNFIKTNVNYLQGNLLDVGCGEMPYKQYILTHSQVTKYTGIDIEDALNYNNVKPDLYWDGKELPLENNMFDTILATEVLEHCPNPQQTLNEIHRVLKKGCVFLFTVPYLWPLHEVPHDYYRYTPFVLNKILSEIGFTKIMIKPTGGWDASLAQMIGLWAKRRPGVKGWKKKLITNLAFHCMKYLIRKDQIPKKLTESTMITGITGIAIK